MKGFSKLLNILVVSALVLLIVSNLPEDVNAYTQQDNEQELYLATINNQENVIQPAFLPALPIGLIIFKEALIALGALIGATALATFVNYAIKHGMTEACKKYSKNNKHIKNSVKIMASLQNKNNKY